MAIAEPIAAKPPGAEMLARFSPKAGLAGLIDNSSV